MDTHKHATDCRAWLVVMSLLLFLGVMTLDCEYALALPKQAHKQKQSLAPPKRGVKKVPVLSATGAVLFCVKEVKS